MRYAQIQNGKVVNCIMVDNPNDFPDMVLIQSDTAETGDNYANGVFTRPAPVVIVPEAISATQFRRALTHFGLRSAIEAGVASADQDTKDMYEFSASFHRDNPLLNDMASLLGIQADQVDQVFIYGASLQ